MIVFIPFMLLIGIALLTGTNVGVLLVEYIFKRKRKKQVEDFVEY